jgi:hypothetical protein
MPAAAQNLLQLPAHELRRHRQELHAAIAPLHLAGQLVEFPMS